MQVTIGLPVYNGAHRGLRRAIEQLLAQTFGDFVLVVSDNCSTDGTREVVESFKDKRVLWLPNQINVGALTNFKRCLDVATTPYFMWAADDDQHTPDYIEKCLKAMQPDTALAYPLARQDNEVQPTIPLDQPQAAFRFLKCFTELPNCFPFYGLWRTQAAKSLNWKSLLWGFDFVALCDACLHGKFTIVPEVLFEVAPHKRKDYGEQVRSYARNLEPGKQFGLTLPIVEKVAAVFDVMICSKLPDAEKEQLLPMLLEVIQRYKPYMLDDLARVREKVLQGRWGDGWLTDVELGASGKEYHRRKLLQRLEDAEYFGLEVGDIRDALK